MSISILVLVISVYLFVYSNRYKNKEKNLQPIGLNFMQKKWKIKSHPENLDRESSIWEGRHAFNYSCRKLHIKIFISTNDQIIIYHVRLIIISVRSEWNSIPSLGFFRLFKCSHQSYSINSWTNWYDYVKEYDVDNNDVENHFDTHESHPPLYLSLFFKLSENCFIIWLLFTR